jgi:hypothetical protein
MTRASSVALLFIAASSPALAQSEKCASAYAAMTLTTVEHMCPDLTVTWQGHNIIQLIEQNTEKKCGHEGAERVKSEIEAIFSRAKETGMDPKALYCASIYLMFSQKPVSAGWLEEKK